MSKKIVWSLSSLLLLSLLLLNEGVRNELVAHSNRFRSIIIYGSSGITNAGGMTLGSDLVSDTDGTDDLGTTTVRWDQIYADEVFWNKGADVASAADGFTLGSDGNYYDVTGTTNLDSIAAQTVGKVVVLQFDGVLTMTDGGNLKLHGDFVTAAGAVIMLQSDGTDWYEISRGGGSLAVQGAGTFLSTLTTGAAGSGTDVTFYSSTSGDDFLWDASEEQLNITGTNNQDALIVDDGDVNIYDNMTVSGAFNFLADTSVTNDTYGGTIDPPLQAWNTGTVLIMTVGVNNTTACTVAPDGLAAKSVKTASGADPASSDLVTTSVSLMVYDGTNLLLLNPATSTD